MITCKQILEGYETVTSIWGEDVADRIAESEIIGCGFKEFLNHCTACGGDWGQMFLTGIKKLRPKVYYAIPDEMGAFAFIGIANTLLMLGVDPMT